MGQWLGTCRYIYNLCLEYLGNPLPGHHLSLNKNDVQKEQAVLVREVLWLARVTCWISGNWKQIRKTIIGKNNQEKLK
jgi:hypothetical protein